MNSSFAGDMGPRPSAYGGDGPLMLGIVWTETILTIILLSLRTYVFAKVAKSSIWALAWAWLAFLLSLLATIFLTIAIHYGMGNHIVQLAKAGTIQACIRTLLEGVAVSYISLGISKVAIVAWLLCITGVTTSPVTKYALYFLAVTTLILNTTVGFINLFQCGPQIGNFSTGCPGARPAEILTYIASGYGAFVDLILALYPIIVIAQLQMKLKTKVMLCCLMGLGLITCVCACLKTWQIGHAAYSQDTVSDPTYDQIALSLFQWTETSLVQICACIPPLWPLIRRRMDSKKNSGRPSSYERKAMWDSGRPGASSPKPEDSHQITSEERTSEGVDRQLVEKEPEREGEKDVITVTREVSIQEGPMTGASIQNDDWVDWKGRGPTEWV